MPAYDIIVIGLGVMGSAALHRLARRGYRALGIERFQPGHDRGSSHGETRIIRLGYFEHPSYVPLLREAYVLWRELEAESRRKLLTVTGIVEIGPPDGELVAGTLASSRLHGLPHDVMDAAETTRRFPAFAIPDDYTGVFQPDGGFLAAEPAVCTLIDQARTNGAQIQTGTRVEKVEPSGSGVRITTSNGVIDAGAAIVAAGPWLSNLLPALPAKLQVTRQVLGWLSLPSPERFAPEKFPVFLFESRHGIHYGFPIHDATGLKLSKHHHFREPADPDAYDRTVSPKDEAAILAFRDDHLPSASGPLIRSQTCLYTMTPDGHFIVDTLPGAPQIVVASPCSGHGFKFAPIIGDIAAELATQGTTRRDISLFRLSRFV